MTHDGYQQLYDTMVVRIAKQSDVELLAKKIVMNRSKYQVPAERTGVPWYVVAIIHTMECSMNFARHLHNGDPLTAKTVHVPAGRPLQGSPPYDWSSSAIDALQLRGLDKWHDWSVPGILEQLEKYNGLGYQKKAINTPYLWSFTNHYSKGKYVSDGHYDPTAVSIQCGAAPLLKALLK